MTQKQATSAAPIELKPSEEVKPKPSASKTPSEAKAVEVSVPAESARTAGKTGKEPEVQPSRNTPQRRIPENGGDGVPVSSGSPRPVGQRRPTAAARPHIPANDDMPSIGGLIYALQQR